MALELNTTQKRIYDTAALLTEYTFAELCTLAKSDMPAVDEGYFHTPGYTGPNSFRYGDVKGLVDAGYFTESVVAYGDATDLDDYTFAKVANPPTSWGTLSAAPWPCGTEVLS